MRIVILLISLLIFFNKNLNAQETSDSISKLDLLFIGDIMGHKPQIKSAEIKTGKYVAPEKKQYNYNPCFQYIKPIVDKADFAIANLEVTLPGEPPYLGYPSFRSPNELAAALRGAGFDLLVTANNHSNDAGKKGVIGTVNTVKKNGFYQTGTFLNAQEKELLYPLIVYKNDFKIAFLNYTYDTNSIKTQAPTVVNYIDEKLIEKDMELAKEMQPDAIIVIMHWGKEYKLIENKTQSGLAKKIFSWGADLVIGMHPHVVQPIREMEIMQADSSMKKTLVTYSLGNFISNQKKPNTDGGLMFEISLLKNKKTNKVTLGEHHYIPVWRYVYQETKKKRTYFTVPIAAFENGNEGLLDMDSKNKKAMSAFAKHTRTHLKQFDSSERKVKLEELGEVPKLGVVKSKSVKKKVQQAE